MGLDRGYRVYMVFGSSVEGQLWRLYRAGVVFMG